MQSDLSKATRIIRTMILGSALFLFLSNSAGWALTLDFTDPVPTGPSAGTAGETLETGATFSVGILDVEAIPSSTSLMGDGLLANDTSFGVNSDNFDSFVDIPQQIQLDGFAEELTIKFNRLVLITSIDLNALVGNEAATVSAGPFSIDLTTGVTGFNGTTDVYTPASPIPVSLNGGIVFRGKTAGASFGLQGMDLVVVPEPSTFIPAAIALLGLTLCSRRRRRRTTN